MNFFDHMKQQKRVSAFQSMRISQIITTNTFFNKNVITISIYLYLKRNIFVIKNINSNMYISGINLHSPIRTY